MIGNIWDFTVPHGRRHRVRGDVASCKIPTSELSKIDSIDRQKLVFIFLYLKVYEKILVI